MRFRLPAIENGAQRVQIDPDRLAIRIRKRRVFLQEIDVVDGAHQTLTFGLPLAVFGRDHITQAFQIFYRGIVTIALLIIQLVAPDDVAEVLVGPFHSITDLIAKFRYFARMCAGSHQSNGSQRQKKRKIPHNDS